MPIQTGLVSPDTKRQALQSARHAETKHHCEYKRSHTGRHLDRGVTVMNHHKLIETIITFSNLMLCFIFGAIVSIVACLFDYNARVIYGSGRPKKLLLVDVAEIYDVCAFMVFVASLMIFVWGSYLTIYLVRGAFY